MFWILNPDAELELERPLNYQTNHATLAAMRRMASRFRLLTGDDDMALLPDLLPATPLARRALLWCPTPFAVRSATRLGYELPACPPPAVLASANDKAMLAASSLPAPACRELLEGEDALQRAQGLLEAFGPLRLKRRFGFAGRRQRKIRAPLQDDDLRFLNDGMRLGGLVVESELDVTAEFSIHGVVAPGGPTPLLGYPARVATDRYGSVMKIERLPTAHPRVPELIELGGRAAALLADLGYFGPFGLDVLETSSGLVGSDLNARFTLGFRVGLGERLDEARALLFERPPLALGET